MATEFLPHKALVIRTMIAAALLAFGTLSHAVDLSPSWVEPRQGDGCWVRVFGEPGFERPLGLLAGNLYITSVAEPGLIGPWSEKEFLQRLRSLIVGPDAALIAYAETGFNKEFVWLGPGFAVNDLRDLKFAERVASLKILCD